MSINKVFSTLTCRIQIQFSNKILQIILLRDIQKHEHPSQNSSFKMNTSNIKQFTSNVSYNKQAVSDTGKGKQGNVVLLKL